MQTRNKILVATCLCLVGFAGFFISTGQADKDDIISKYRQTSNGSYYQKELRVSEILLDDNSSDGNNQSGDLQYASQPTDNNVDSWINYITASQMSDTRKGIVLEALDTIKKHCIYHQLRAGQGSPKGCMGGCDKESVGEYDFATQADYKLADPLYLDCSFFVKHCYYTGGYDIASSNTAMLYTNAEFTTLGKESLVPGDIAVRKGHTLIYLGTTTDGQLAWAEMQNHAGDSTIRISALDARYIYRRYGALAMDTTFIGAQRTISSTQQNKLRTYLVQWNMGLEYADTTAIRNESLNEYVYISRGHDAIV